MKLTIYCDGGARGNPGPAASAFAVEKDGKVIYKNAKYLGSATNNIAEYNAVTLALGWLSKSSSIESRVSSIELILDSELVAKQLSGLYKVKNQNLKKLFDTAKDLEEKISYSVVPRTKNKLADFLVNETLDSNL